jgi:uncharacterized repeat protein (TIGR01451 family)
MKKIFYSTIICLAAFLAHGQIWNQVGNGLTSTNNVSYTPFEFELGGSIAVSYTSYSGNPAQSTAHTKVWNGVSWSAYPDISMGSWGYVFGAGGLAGTPYVLLSSGNIKYYDGTTWVDLGMPSTGDARSLHKVGNELLIKGNFTNGDWGYLFDGTNFTVLNAPSVNVANVEDAIYFNNELYITGSLDSNSTTGPIDLLKYSSGAWSNPVNWIEGTTLPSWATGTGFLADYGGSLYLTGSRNLFRLSNDTVHRIDTLQYSNRDMEVYNGELYISQYNSLLRYDGNNTALITQVPGTQLKLISYQSELYAFSADTNNYNGTDYNFAYRTQGGFSFVSGNIYTDSDQNCIKGLSEAGIPKMAVKFNTGDVISTNNNGNYAINLAPGSYTIDQVYSIDAVTSQVSVNCTLPISITLAANSTLTQDIGAEVTQVEDVSVQLIGAWRARYGFTENYTVRVSNPGIPVAAGGTLEVTIPSTTTLVSSNPSATVSGNTLSWTLGAMATFDVNNFNFQLKIDTATHTIGDTIEVGAQLLGFPNDAVTSNNSSSLKQEVRAAYDPNDKRVNIERAEPGNLSLEYNIRFQNTGNDTAYKVVVVDTLSAKLDPGSFQMLGATHDYEVLLESNVVSFIFENILLPDSTTDVEGSQGGLQFSINSAAALTDGEKVSNDAYIYFDFQQPIHTNFAITEVEANISLEEQLGTELSLELYPNPATDFVQLKSQSNERQEVGLYNSNGQQVKHLSLPAKGSVKLQLNELRSGLYFVKTETETYKMIITR